MKALTVEQQVAMLRPGMSFAAHMHHWLLAGAAMGVMLAVIFWHPIPLMIAAFLGLVGFSEQRAGPNIVAAIVAYDSGTPSNGEVAIAITCWDTDKHYHATVREPGHPNWKYEFVPQGWQPASRSCLAQIWRSGSDGSPVLAVVEQGILIPRHEPKLAGKLRPSS
ncbi:MAG TPA: hypothetical protein PLB25_02710 [Rhodoferax sp.]|nr:hypothetical protein [Rhodoferax sp.]